MSSQIDQQLIDNVELLAPAGGFEALDAAIKAGANAIFFGVKGLNMRANVKDQFEIEDIPSIVEQCHQNNVAAYLALNTLVYDEDLERMHQVIDAAKDGGVDALILFDLSVIDYAKQSGLEVHISTQHSISNIEAVKLFSQWADRVVLARELTLEQIKRITDQIKEQDVRGPKGNLMEVEIFIHGAMCVSVSGRCG
ncbi:U32 family peptidase, partial [Candidatus Uhrbacteria bacterium]|nr:U32 family peptidase [Candidatus Uhrbacteria bacterium]